MRTAKRVAIGFAVFLVLSFAFEVGRQRLWFSGPISQDEIVFDLPSVAGKSFDEVVAVLGKPDSSEDTSNSGRLLKKYFWNPRTQVWDGPSGFKQHSVVFVDGKADWISISGTGGLSYGRDRSLRAINLPPGPAPTNISNMATRWDDGMYPGYRSLSVFKGRDGRLNGFHVCVNTEP